MTMSSGIEPARAAVIVFDMLNDFLKPGQSRHIAELTVGNTVRLLRGARAVGMFVCYANSYRRTDERDSGLPITDANMRLERWPDGPQRLPRRKAVEGTVGAEVVNELLPEPEDFIVPKLRWSAFAGTPLDMVLRGRGIDTVLLTGGSTDVGIAATAFAARDLGYNLILVRDCCHSAQQGAHEYFMDRVFPRMGRVMPMERALELIGEPRP